MIHVRAYSAMGALIVQCDDTWTDTEGVVHRDFIASSTVPLDPRTRAYGKDALARVGEELLNMAYDEDCGQSIHEV